MTFDATERSIQDAAPVELYDFVAPVQTWRLTTFQSDVVFGGNTYTAVTSARSSIAAPDLATDQGDVSIELPASHALARAYVNGIPMRDLLVTITRYYPTFGVSLQWWKGYASGISFARAQDGPTAAFRVPSGTNDALATDVPSVVCQRLCNHVLYDAQCTIARAGFQVVTTITSISSDGKTIGLAAGVPAVAATQAPWSRFGELLHATSTERRTIVDQPALNSIVLQAPYPNGAINVGDAVTVFAGCDHKIQTCDVKFANGVNFGGYPHLPPSNFFGIFNGTILGRTSQDVTLEG